MEKKILVYDDNGTESEEFRTMLAQLSSQTVKVNTRAQTPPLPFFTTSSQPSAQLQTSTPVTTLTTSTSTPVATTSASASSPPTPTDSICASIFFSFSDTGLRDIANGHWNLYRYSFYGRFFYGKKKKRKDIAIGGDKNE